MKGNAFENWQFDRSLQNTVRGRKVDQFLWFISGARGGVSTDCRKDLTPGRTSGFDSVMPIQSRWTARKWWDLPGGPVVRTLLGGNVGLIPGCRSKKPDASQHSKINKWTESKLTLLGTSLAYQRLRLWASKAGVMGSIPGWGAKNRHVTQWNWKGGQRVGEKKRKNEISLKSWIQEVWFLEFLFTFTLSWSVDEFFFLGSQPLFQFSMVAVTKGCALSVLLFNH